MKVTLGSNDYGWEFTDSKGRRVRVDWTEAGTFASESEAVAAAERHGYRVVGSRLVQAG